MNKLSKAFTIASKGFEGTTDKGGRPYILHCIRVMNNLNSSDDELNAIAILHDTVEDGVITIEDVFSTFGVRIGTAVQLLTHDKSEPYEYYIQRIATNADARAVKIADLRDNTDVTRLKGLTKKDFDRMEKYHKAYVYLSKI